MELVAKRVKRCAFCEEYKNAYGLAEYDRNHGRKVYFLVRLYEHVVRRGGKEYRSKTHRPMKLRFCPSCGKELRIS